MTCQLCSRKGFAANVKQNCQYLGTFSPTPTNRLPVSIMRHFKFTPEEAKQHAVRYAIVLQGVIDRCRAERLGNNWDCNDIVDCYGDELYNAVWRCASSFPSDINSSYQAAMYIGYLRGKSDMLDAVGRIINDELKDNHEELNELIGELFGEGE